MSDTKQERPFEWTDELVLAFARYTNLESPTFQGRYTDLEQFKASHSIKEEEVGWEIVAFKLEDGSVVPKLKDKRGYFSWHTEGSFNIKIYTTENMLTLKYPIHSVRRLSDGEVFTVGDEVIYEDINPLIITSFKIEGNAVEVRFNQKGYVYLDISMGNQYQLQKAPKKQPLPIADDKKMCNVCGGEMVLIRGRYPKEDKRYTCPTCVTERLEAINEMSSKHYGDTNSNN